MKNNLPYPFNEAFEHGDSIDYRTGAWSQENDHTYVEKLGYEPKMLSDCSYCARGLNGFNLSSYGNWGTFYANDAGKKEKEIFLDMIEKDIIRPWRIRAYRNRAPYDYSDGKWMTYVNSAWVECNDPYKNSEN